MIAVVALVLGVLLLPGLTLAFLLRLANKARHRLPHYADALEQGRGVLQSRGVDVDLEFKGMI